VRALYIPATAPRASMSERLFRSLRTPFQQRKAGRIEVLRGAFFSRDAIFNLAA